MAFINELIPEEQKDKFTFSVKTYRDGSKPTLWKWTIDRERDAFLVHTNTFGGGYEGTPEEECYVLSWHNELIYFQADPSGVGKEEYTYVVHHLKIPTVLEEQKEEVMELIREALDAKGNTYLRDHLEVVHVKFDFSIVDKVFPMEYGTKDGEAK